MTTEHSAESKDWVIELQNALNRYFSKDDLESLCLSLDLDYEGLPGDSKQRKIVELIQYMVRAGRMDQLIENCGKQRPNVDWQEMLTAAKENPLRLETEFKSVNAVRSQPQPASNPGGLLRNKWVLGGIGGAVLLVILIVFLVNSFGSITADLGVKQERVDALLAGVAVTGQRSFEENAAGWQVASPQAIFAQDFGLTMRPQNSLIRNRSFGPGDAIILDFELPQLAGGAPQVEFVLQTGEDRETAVGLVVVEVSEQVRATAVFDGESVAPTNFDQSLAMETDYLFSAMLAVDPDGTILVTVWDDFDPNLHSTYVYNPGAEWANVDWRVNITTPTNGEVVLDEWWDLSFDDVR